MGSQARSGGFRVERSDRGAWLSGAWANVHEAAVDFAIEAGVQPFVEGLYRTATHDSLSHTVESAARECGRRPQAEIGKFVERDRLSVQIENWMFREFG